MDKRWTLAIVTILMVILIYAFLSMILKTDKTKPAHSRMYRDYSSYSKKDNDDSDNYIFERRTYASAAEARKTKRTMFDNIVTYSANSYNQFLQDSIKTPPNKEFFKTVTNPQYQHMIKLSQISLPELQSAISAFRNGEYETAVSFLNTALNKLDPMEMKKRIEIYSLLAECSIKLKDNDGYIQNKIRQIRIQRKYQKLLKEHQIGFEKKNNPFCGGSI